MAETGPMHIVCPHCSTAYAIGASALGQAGRTVRCSRCKETWLARPEDAFDAAMVSATAAGGPAQAGAAAEWDAMARNDADGLGPVVASPPTAGDWVEGESGSPQAGDGQGLARDDALEAEISRQRSSWFARLGKGPANQGGRGKSIFGLPAACAAMGALVLALIIWRVDVVRLIPQTASFYRMVGLDVNLRGLVFKDVKVTTETVEGKPVLVIEGVIVDDTHKTVEIPRLRFSVRDAQGTEIYAWNTVLEQTVLKPGDHASFRSRLASPPVEGKSIDVRFFNRHDIAGGSP
jgi:predicted Zn finger-like uncharacterized protein